MPGQNKVKHLVVDTSAFIKNLPLQNFASNVYTVQTVIDEIKSKRQLRNLVVLPYDLKVKDVFSESIKFVTEFSKKTGDYSSLSAVDIQVMALTYQLEKEHKGIDHLNVQPQVLKVANFTEEALGSYRNIAGFYIPSAKNLSPPEGSSMPDSGELPREDEEGEEGERKVEEDDLLSEKSSYHYNVKYLAVKQDKLVCITGKEEEKEEEEEKEKEEETEKQESEDDEKNMYIPDTDKVKYLPVKQENKLLCITGKKEEAEKQESEDDEKNMYILHTDRVKCQPVKQEDKLLCITGKEEEKEEEVEKQESEDDEKEMYIHGTDRDNNISEMDEFDWQKGDLEEIISEAPDIEYNEVGEVRSNACLPHTNLDLCDLKEVVDGLKKMILDPLKDKEGKLASSADGTDGTDYEDADDYNYDEEDDDDIWDNKGWITPKNVKKVTQLASDADLADDPTEVACITGDFAMQNVMRQLGLQVLALNGSIIKQLRTYILRCYSCSKTTSRMELLFCPHCGNRTLKRAAVALRPDGTQEVIVTSRRPITSRGKRFSLPKPQGGKHANNPLLCPDQRLPQQFASRLARTKNNPLGEDYTAGFSPFIMRDVNSRSAMLGIRNVSEVKNWMRKNPNEVRKKGKKHRN